MESNHPHQYDLQILPCMPDPNQRNHDNIFNTYMFDLPTRAIESRTHNPVSFTRPLIPQLEHKAHQSPTEIQVHVGSLPRNQPITTIINRTTTTTEHNQSSNTSSLVASTSTSTTSTSASTSTSTFASTSSASSSISSTSTSTSTSASISSASSSISSVSLVASTLSIEDVSEIGQVAPTIDRKQKIRDNQRKQMAAMQERRSKFMSKQIDERNKIMNHNRQTTGARYFELSRFERWSLNPLAKTLPESVSSHSLIPHPEKALRDMNFICSICRDVCRSCVETRCGHTFCADCLRDFLRSNAQYGCPQCRQPYRFSAEESCRVSHTLSNNIDFLFVFHCPHHGLGCNWQGKFSFVESHLHDDCLFTRFLCCGTWRIRPEHEHHLLSHNAEVLSISQIDRHNYKQLMDLWNLRLACHLHSNPVKKSAPQTLAFIENLALGGSVYALMILYDTYKDWKNLKLPCCYFLKYLPSLEAIVKHTTHTARPNIAYRLGSLYFQGYQCPRLLDGTEDKSCCQHLTSDKRLAMQYLYFSAEHSSLPCWSLCRIHGDPGEFYNPNLAVQYAHWGALMNNRLCINKSLEFCKNRFGPMELFSDSDIEARVKDYEKRLSQQSQNTTNSRETITSRS
jgi:hypothetical protein